MAYANKDANCAVCNGPIAKGDEIKFKALGGGKWAPKHVDCPVQQSAVPTPAAPAASSPDPIASFWTVTPAAPIPVTPAGLAEAINERDALKRSYAAKSAATPPPIPPTADLPPIVELSPAELIVENERELRRIMERYAAEFDTLLISEGAKWPLAHTLALKRIIKLVRADNGRATMRVMA